MRLFELFREPLLELRLRYRPPFDTGSYSNLIAFRGNYWILPEHNKMDQVDPKVFYDIAQAIGMEDYEEGDDADYFQRVFYDLVESRPDVIVGAIHGDVLYLSIQDASSQDPRTSSMLKKIVADLGLSGIRTEKSDWYGDPEESDLIGREEMRGALPEYLYHGTTSVHMRGIARTGLTPGAVKSNWEKVGITHANKIFGSTSIEGALFHANRSAGISSDPHDKDHGIDPDTPFPVIIKFKVPDPNLLVPDYDVAAEVMGVDKTTDRLGYTSVDNYARFTNASEIRKHNPEGRTWKSAGLFGYQGRVPPSHIVQVYSDFFNTEPLSNDIEWSGTLKEFFIEWDRREQAFYGEDEDE